MISRNIAGQTKKSTIIATNFVAWAVGNSIGKFYQDVKFAKNDTHKVLQAPKSSWNGMHHVILLLSLSILFATVSLS